jgi:hypothetical protein
MNRISLLICLCVQGVLTCTCAAETLPREGTFSGYFHIDRWKQPVFDIFYVDPPFAPQLEEKGWLPIRITTREIRQPANPGGGMIRQIENTEVLDKPPLEILVGVLGNRLRYGNLAKLVVTIQNRSEKPLELARDYLLLSVTLHQRGLLPEREPARDEIYDSLSNPYCDDTSNIAFLRATIGVHLYAFSRDVEMGDGRPHLLLHTEGKRRRAEISDWVANVLAPHETWTLSYTIGRGWFINEYELQVRCRTRPPSAAGYILSKPIAFDVTR